MRKEEEAKKKKEAEKAKKAKEEARKRAAVEQKLVCVRSRNMSTADDARHKQKLWRTKCLAMIVALSFRESSCDERLALTS